ncbi:DUF6928 family protein [Streptomyces sp. NPDC001797]|uniref:DUF6928 family protein n=1 Tax=Streptomyces sp. NPDC001797 TaxID=3364610 RepID=UPI0036AADDD9
MPWPDEDEEPYPLAFHPLELGEDALRALCGFIQEGRPDPDDVDADTIELHGSIRGTPTGPISQNRKRRCAEPWKPWPRRAPTHWDLMVHGSSATAFSSRPLRPEATGVGCCLGLARLPACADGPPAIALVRRTSSALSRS